MVVEAKRLYDTKRKEESSTSKQWHPIIIGIKPNQFVYAPSSQQNRHYLDDKQSVGPEQIDQRRKEDQIQVEMVAENTLRHILKHATVVDAKVHVVVHGMGVKSQVKRIRLEKEMVNQGYEAIQDAGNGEYRCQRDVFLPLTQGHRLHTG